jgi:hypothetical protein
VPVLGPAKPHPEDRRDFAEARRDLANWTAKWSGKYSKLTGWAEENIDETLTFYRLPRQHHKHLKSTNMLERLNAEIRRRTHVVRIFPNGESCLRLVQALAVETHEKARAAICASTRRRHCAVPPDPRPVQPSAVLARSRDAARRLRRCRRSRGGILDCRCARRSATTRSRRRDGHFRSNKGMLL